MKRRKKIHVILLVCFIQLFIIFCGGMSTYSVVADEKNADGLLQDTAQDMLGELDLADLEAYIRSLGIHDNGTLTERLLSYVKGGDMDFSSLGNEIVRILLEKARDLLPAFACITGISLLSGILSTLQAGGNAKGTTEVIFVVCYVGALLPLFVVIAECFQAASSCLQGLTTQMQIVYPLLLTLMAVGGGNVTVTVCRPAVAFFSNTIVSVITGVVLPLTVLIILFSMAANITRELKINKFSAFFKSINKWIIGLCVSVFGIFFTLQGITAMTYDGIVRRATKYAIGNGVPIIGGFLSGGFDLAVAGSALIKNALGNMSIFLMIFVLLEPVLLLVSVNVLLRFTAAVTQPFGDSRISDFLGETAENLQYCTASVLFTGFLYFLSVLLLVVSTESLL